MADQNNKNVDALAQEITLKSRGQGKLRQFILWMGALIIGAILGWQHIPVLNDLFNFIAAVFTHLFQFIAIYCNTYCITSSYYHIVHVGC